MPAKRVLLSMMVVAAMTGAAAAEPPGRLPTGPQVGDHDLSPFYRWSDALPDKPGAVLRQEPQPAQAEINAAGTATRLLYTSTDARWRSGIVPVSGTLYLPTGTPPAGGWPLVAWAHGTLGVSDRCAPSWAGHKPRDAAYINRWLQNGFAVVATDYQGLGGPGPHPYLIWEAEGRSVLDAARAALVAGGGRIANKLFVTGQSQGSGAAIGATRLAESYAPDVKLKATLATGVVPSFPEGPYKPAPLAITTPVFTILMMVGGGLPDDGPTADTLVGEPGKPVLAAARDGCTAEMAAAARAGQVSVANAFSRPPEAIASSLTKVTDMSMVRLPVPVMLGTGLADKLVVPTYQFGAVAALCAAGSPILWRTYPGVTHNGGVHASFNDALAFFRAVDSGQPPPANCASITPPGAPQDATAGLAYND
ncbi:MAG: lipase family protein [Reyranellaceae bacterium]